MTLGRFVRRSLAYYWQVNLTVIAGVAVAVVVGAVVVGICVVAGAVGVREIAGSTELAVGSFAPSRVTRSRMTMAITPTPTAARTPN